MILSCTPNLQVLYIILPPKVINSHTNGDKARQGNSYSNVLCHNQKDGNQSTHIKYKHINIRAKKQTPQSTPKRDRNHLKSTPKIYVAGLTKEIEGATIIKIKVGKQEVPLKCNIVHNLTFPIVLGRDMMNVTMIAMDYIENKIYLY